MFGLPFSLPKFGDGIGLSRIMGFYQSHPLGRGEPHWLSRRSIVVTGSNGKGSTAQLAAALLQADGQRVGLFTSPHLFDVTERFVIGDKRIPREAFERHAATVKAYNDTLPEGGRMGAFEFLFLIAALWFDEEQVDTMVWEAGIGGRYDPVRTLEAGVSALTSLELEHTQLLGATEELIAYDKIDALAPNGRLIVSPSVSDGYRTRIATYCALSERRAFFVDDYFSVENASNTSRGAEFTLRTPGPLGQSMALRLHLPGLHQIDNALTALTLAHTYSRGEFGVDLPNDAEAKALATTHWPGRLEKVASSPDLWIDVGHTPRALDLVTSAFLDIAPRGKTLVVFGVSASKEVARIATTVASRFDNFILTRAHKAGADIASFVNAFAGKQVTIEQDVAAAARLARERATGEGLTVLAIGGLFLAAEVQHAWNGGDPNELEFF